MEKSDRERLARLRAAARKQVSRYPQYKFDKTTLCTVQRKVDTSLGHAFNAGEVSIREPGSHEGMVSVWSFKNGTWALLDPAHVRDGVSGARPSPRYAKQREALPTIDECVRRRTHMLRSTGDGHCKVCFDRSDLDEFNLLEVNALTGAATPLRARRRAR